MEKITSCVRKLAIWCISCYRATYSAVSPPCCRFYPTCSSYAKEAILLHGVLRGGGLTIKRLLRCHPFSSHFGVDFVPQEKD